MDHLGGLPAETDVRRLTIQTNSESCAQGGAERKRLRHTERAVLLQRRLQRRVCKRPSKIEKLRCFPPSSLTKATTFKLLCLLKRRPAKENEIATCYIKHDCIHHAARIAFRMKLGRCMYQDMLSALTQAPKMRPKQENEIATRHCTFLTLKKVSPSVV